MMNKDPALMAQYVAKVIKLIENPPKKYVFQYADVKLLDRGFIIYWGIEDFGFGTFTVVFDGKQILMDTESMSPEFVVDLLWACKDKLLEKLEIL